MLYALKIAQWNEKELNLWHIVEDELQGEGSWSMNGIVMGLLSQTPANYRAVMIKDSYLQIFYKVH